MSFYMVLPSNGSRYYPENRAGNYKIRLPYKVRIQPTAYEVALSELTYICSIKTLTGLEDDNVIEYDGLEAGYIDLPLTHYSSIKHLLDTISEQFKKKAVPLHFYYSDVKSRVSLSVGSGYGLILSEKLSIILGFNGQVRFNSDVPPLPEISIFFYANFRADLLGGKHHMFIYCNIIDSQIVGSSLVPLLRMINISENAGQAVTQTFSSPFYHSTSLTEFDTISILLCDEFGEELPIDKGQVTLTLHFKKVSE